MNKVTLILVDGMRPDGFLQCGHPYVKNLLAESSYTMGGKSVSPSVTLPCHMTLFHSVEPLRHGTTTNTYAPQVRPVEGLNEVLSKNRKSCAMFYNWEPLRDIARPGSLACSYFFSGHAFRYEKANNLVCEKAISYLQAYEPDFAFVYLGEVDAAGHKYGWMSEDYLEAVYRSIASVQRIMENTDRVTIITADHGGHDRIHGTEMKEDMCIPMIFNGSMFEKGKELSAVSLLDIAPTIASLAGCEPSEDWEGSAVDGSCS